MSPTAPDSEAPWLTPAACAIAARLLDGHRAAFGRPLLAGCGDGRSPRQRAQELFAATTVVLAHDGGEDPRLIWASREALRLWGRRWSQMVGMPSRLTAEPRERAGRSAALAEARRQTALVGYGGIRVDSRGRRFRIENARLWTLWDERGAPCGQAAAFARWWWL